jgi:hypothetical protein
MDYRRHTFAAAFHDAKSAALYFDYVLPVEFAEVMTDKGHLKYYDILRELLPKDLLDTSTPTGLRKEMIDCVTSYILMFPDQFTDVKIDDTKRHDLFEKGFPKLLATLSQLVSLSHNAVTDVMLGVSDLQDPLEGKGTPSLILSELQLIDTEKVSWPQIVEFRKDEQARDALTRLRLFVYQQYDGKPREFIEEDLGERIRQYEATARSWGFTTKTAALKAIIGSKTTLAVLGATVSTLFGVPLAAIFASAAVGVALDIAGISVAVTEKVHDKKIFDDTSSVAYLVDASHHLNPA